MAKTEETSLLEIRTDQLEMVTNVSRAVASTLRMLSGGGSLDDADADLALHMLACVLEHPEVCA